MEVCVRVGKRHCGTNDDNIRQHYFSTMGYTMEVVIVDTRFLLDTETFSLVPSIQFSQYLPEITFTMSTMKAVGVSIYGLVDNLESRNVPKPNDPTGRQVLVRCESHLPFG
jgi:hypothetical protein